MQKEQFISLLMSPFPANEDAVKQVKEITREFPFFQSAHLLYAKLLKETGSIHFDSQLKVSAVYSANRKQLFHLIEKTFPEKVLESVGENETEAHPIVEEIKEQPVIPVAEFKKDVEYKIEDHFTPLYIKEETVIETKQPVEEIIPVAEPAKEVVEETKPDFTGHINETHSFLQWLTYGKTMVPKTTEVIKTVDTKDISSENISSVESNREEVVKEETVIPANEIIERFIKEEPRISPAKASFYSPVNMARKSVEENDELVSPTLAQIYLAQGNKPKAVETYEKLILLYPEKSAFFATQIEKIKKSS